jgi:AAA domain
MSEFRVYSTADLAELPPPAYLVGSLIVEGGFNVLYGASGSCKSILGIDWACCVATGREWWGRPVQRGSVVYIAAEGARGILPRVEAWADAHLASTLPELHWIPEAINLLSEQDTEDVVSWMRELDRAPSLLIVDTLARSMTGGDENTARDVGQYIANVGRLQAEFGLASLTIHHTGHDESRERGSSALKGAADMHMRLSIDKPSVTLECKKEKDGPEFAPWHLVLTPHRESAILALRSQGDMLTASRRALLVLAVESFRSERVPSGALRKAFTGADSTFYEAAGALVNSGLLHRNGRGNAVWYQATDAGRQRLDSNRLHPDSNGVAPDSVQPPLPRGLESGVKLMQRSDADLLAEADRIEQRLTEDGGF